jgi:hypothetical protein
MMADSLWCYRSHHLDREVKSVHAIEQKQTRFGWCELKIKPCEQWEKRITELNQILEKLSSEDQSLISDSKLQRLHWLFDYCMTTCSLHGSMAAWCQGIQLVSISSAAEGVPTMSFITDSATLFHCLGKKCSVLVDYSTIASSSGALSSAKVFRHNPSDNHPDSLEKDHPVIDDEEEDDDEEFTVTFE